MFRTKDSNGNPKYIGRSKAVVLDNRDPLNRGRVVVDHPLLGETVWIDYLMAPGTFTAPSVGDIVYVECDSGEVEFPIAWGNVTKGEDAAPQIPELFKRDVPTNRGIYSPNGHSIELDDGVATANSDPKYTDLTDDSKGIRITTSSGNVIILSDKDKQILIETLEKILLKAPTEVTIDTPKTVITGEEEVQGDINAKANVNVTGNLQVTGNSQLGGGTPLLLATAQFIGTGNAGAPVISTIMSGQSTKSTSS